MTWQDDDLIDWSRGDAYRPDGSTYSIGIRYAYRFDAAVRSACGRYMVVYEQSGTKGLVLRDGRILREIDRSFYCAEAYDFPVALFELPDGRPAIAHCPSEYNRLEIDLLDSGERLTQRAQIEGARASDFFHSGLTVDPGGEWLMSAGWAWHPTHDVRFFPLLKALEDPSILDRSDGLVRHNAEIPSAVFLGPDLAALASDPDVEAFDEETRDPAAQRKGVLGIYRPSSKTWECKVDIAGRLGKILVVDDDHIVSLYMHPKLVNISMGQVMAEWPQIDSGAQAGCISGHLDFPTICWDPIRKRLAVAGKDRIDVLKLEG